MIQAILAALLSLGGTALAEENWQRPWTVKKVFCSACTPEQVKQLLPTLGIVITLEPTRFDNPLYESCPKGVDYSDMRSVSLDDAARVMRPAQLPLGLTGSVVAGKIACAEPGGQPNTIGRFVFNGATGYYLFEGGALLELR